MAEHSPFDNAFAVYHKLSSPLADKIMKQSRERFNTKAITMKETPRVMLKTPNNGQSTFLFISDQSPAQVLIQYDLMFLNQLTPVFNGFDKLTRKLDYAVVYINIKKKKRGQYCFSFERIKPKNNTFKENEIVNSFFEHLEKNIKTDPSNWLWSHRRWKYKKGINY